MSHISQTLDAAENTASPVRGPAARHEMRVWLGMLAGLVLLPWVLQAGGLTMTSVVDCVLLAMVGLYSRTDGVDDPGAGASGLLAADFAALRNDWPARSWKLQAS